MIPTNPSDEAEQRVEGEPVPPAEEDPVVAEAAVKTELPLFPIVGVGASAGGLEAYRRLLRALSPNTGMAFVLVQHLAPEHQSMLATILARETSMPVLEVRDEPRVEPNHVYVIPPNRAMLMTDGHLRLIPRDENRGQLRSIDVFLRSLAEEQSHHAIGVILSGTGSDGTLGLEAIKGEGGITFAQDGSAQHDGMPRSAAAGGFVDYVLPPEGIAAELARIARHPYVAPEAAPEDAESIEARARVDLNRILRLVHHRIGVDFTLYKSTTLFRRITRRMLLHRLDGLADYLALLRDDAGEVQALYQDILINVTEFFRDAPCFETLKARVLPKLVADRPRTDPLRIWVLGCSTGEEAYSLAMTISEYAAERGAEVPAQIFATDLNERGIEKARAGLYGKGIARDVSAERLRRFFIESDGGYQVSKGIREMCVFARQNAVNDPPFSRMDLISCRNMLIYMEPVLQKRLVPTLHYALKPGGFLWLGSSETVSGFADLFEPVESRHKIFAKKPGQASPPILPAATATWEPTAFTGQRRRAVEASGVDMLREADRLVVARYAPPGVLVNADLDVLQFRGDTSPFLAQPPGRPSANVLKMAREGLLVGLRSTLHKAIADDVGTRREGLLVKSNGGFREVDLEVAVVKAPGSKERAFLVLFEDPARGRARARAAAAASEGPSLEAGEAERQVARLTQELAATREYMQSLSEQQEAANEEMQSANEEIQSANEELQTSKEEIQSSNEELTTVNDELRHRNEQLDRAHDDLNNFVASSTLAMVVVGRDLRIRRFTPAAEKLLNLIAADLGRPIGDLKLPLGADDLDDLLRDVIDGVRAEEKEVQDRKGRWYSLRLRPYKTLDNKIDGAVLVLVDIEEQKRIQADLQSGEERYRLLVEGALGVGIMLLDESGRVIDWNAGAERVFGYPTVEIVGRHFSLFFTPEDAASGMPDRELARAVEQGESSDDNWLRRKDGERFFASGSTTALKDEEGKLRAFSKVVRDVTRQKRAEWALQESNLRLQAALSAAQMGTWSWYFEEDRQVLDESLRELMGFDAGAEVVGLEGFLDAIHPDDRDSTREAFLLSARGRGDLDVEFRVARPDGGVRWIRDRGKVVPASQGAATYLLGACVDVTDRHSWEDSLRAADRQKDEFLATLAHELRNPLAPLANTVELLRRTGNDPSAVEKGREVMGRQVRKLARLVDDLLDVARISQGRLELRMERVDLATVVREAIESLRPEIEAKRHRLFASLPDEPVWLDGDAIRLEQIATNLVNNAAKYTDPGGEIRIALKVDGRGDEAVLSVKDSGVGLAPEMRSRVFGFFVRADTSRARHEGGLGIGLSLVKDLVEKHGGSIVAKSDGQGRGSEFVVRLPLRPRGRGGEPDKAEAARARPLATRRILVVDDNKDTASSLAEILRHTGHETRAAFDGRDALEAASEFRPDVVILDLGMPGMDGYALARRLREQADGDKIALLALSGYATEWDRTTSREAGFDGHLAKPVDFDALTRLLAGLE